MINGSETPKSDRDSARTPPYLFGYAQAAFGPFEIDLASDDMNMLCKNHFTISDDALSKSWREHGTSGWCNPPYSNIMPWLEKAAVEAQWGFSTCFLIPTINGERWGEEVCWMATEIRFLFPRVKFLRPDGSVMQGNPRGSMLVYYSGNPFSQNDRPVWSHTNLKELSGPATAA